MTAVRVLAAALAGGLVLAACPESRPAERYSRGSVHALARLDTPGRVIGEVALAGRPVIDGDTIRIRVGQLDSTVRLVALDTEETVKDERSRRDIEEDWPGYLRRKRGSARHPVKAGTPMGDEAKQFALDFFAGVSRVRLERDDPEEIRDRYDRHLAYAFARKNGRWVNYNLEAVRAGMSPYFTKYSISRRFHDQFVAAEKEARAARRGIWNPAKRSYRDYDERKAWWDARARFIGNFERDARGHEDFIVLSRWDSLSRLEKHLGREVTVLGTVSRTAPGDRGPARAVLDVRRSNDLTLVFFDKDVFARCRIDRHAGEFVRATGTVAEYHNQRSHRRQLQLVISRPSQVVLSDVPGIEETVRAAAHR